MKRSEIVDHIESDIFDMLENIKNRPKAAKYQPNRTANAILDMLEGFGMLPPPLDGNVQIKENENNELIIPIWGWDNE